MSPHENDAAFDGLLEYLKTSRGFDFTGYKTTSLKRRVRKRMLDVGIEEYDDYVDYLEVHPEEFAFLFNTILINVTSFFRDPLAWEYLKTELVPKIREKRDSSAPIRFWSAGCASGEEAYSLAMVLAEVLGEEEFKTRVKIYGTDVDEEALAQARSASYTEKVVQDIPKELLDKYFEVVQDRYVFRSDLRRVIVFGRHDLVQDAPISRMDLILCRNTLMYFNAETQGRVLARLHFALNESGYLFLGKAEMLMLQSKLFSPINLKFRIFTKVPKTNLRDRMVILTQAGNVEAASQLGQYVRLREAAFDITGIGHLVVDINGYLVLANEKVRELFNVQQTDLGKPFKDLEISYKPVELRSQIDRALKNRQMIELQNVERTLPNGDQQFLNIRIRHIQDNGSQILGVSLTFEDVTPCHKLQDELLHSHQDLETAYEELQSSNEELETTNEELQSTVEELQTTNEELQSSNEEMETMNEELQSTNYELELKNNEQRVTTSELDQMNQFLQSIIASVHLGVMVIDDSGRVRLWNSRAEDMWGLRSDEVLGQYFTSLDIGLPVTEITSKVANFTERKGKYEEHFLDAVNRKGQAIRVKVTITPGIIYDGTDKGVVLTVEDVTENGKARSLPKHR